MAHIARKYDCILKRDVPQEKRFSLVTTPAVQETDLTDLAPQIKLDQGAEGACTGHGLRTSTTVALKKVFNLDPFDPSPAFYYFNGRRLTLSTEQDSGCSIKDVVMAAQIWGMASNIRNQVGAFPYVAGDYKQQPPDASYKAARCRTVLSQTAITQDPTTLTGLLAMQIAPLIGIAVYESFESDETAKTGIVTLPQAGEQLLGYHCLSVIGHDYPKRIYRVRNSWGPEWGDKGDCWIPFDYLANHELADDFHIVNRIGCRAELTLSPALIGGTVDRVVAAIAKGDLTSVLPSHGVLLPGINEQSILAILKWLCTLGPEALQVICPLLP